MSDTVREELTDDVAAAAVTFIERPTRATLAYLVAAVHSLQEDRGERESPVTNDVTAILKELRVTS